MALDVITDPSNEPMFVLMSKVWLNDRQNKVVPEGSEEARFLLGLPGELVSMRFATRLGLVPKMRVPSSDKQRSVSENK